MFTTRLRALSVFAVLAAAGSGLLLAQSPQAVGTWVGVGAADNPFGNGAAVALTDGRTLIVGGNGTDGAATNVVATFDAATNQFAIAGALLSARTGHTATLLKDGRVLVTGGITNSLVSTDIELFDPSTGASTLVAQMAEPRRGHVAALLQNGGVLIAGGYTSGDAVLQSAFIFDPATNSISPTPGGLNVARASASATSLIDGRVVIVGGTDGTNDLASAEIYDPSLQSFTNVSTQLSVPVRGHSAVLLPHNGSVLVAGGTSNGVAQAGADLFLPTQFPDPFSWGVGQFAPTAAMSAARSSAIAGPSATEGYAVATGGGSNDVERYRFATIKTDKDDYAPGEDALITGTGWQSGEEVRLVFQEDPAVHEDYVLTLTADGAGNISHGQWSPEEHDLGVRFYLTATGQQTGRRAQTTFTDGNRIRFSTNGAATNAFPLALSSVPSNQCVSLFVQEQQGNGASSAPAGGRTVTLSSTPSGATFFPSTNCTGIPTTQRTITAGQFSTQFSFRIATSTTTSYTITGDTSDFGGDNDASATITVTATSVDTTTSIDAPAIPYGQNGSVTVTVSANSGSNTPTGNVSLSVDGGTAVTRALVGGSYNFTQADVPALATPSAVNHSLNASYAGATGFNASGPTAGTLTVNRAPVTATAGNGSGTYNGQTQSPDSCVVSGAYVGDLTCVNNPVSVGPNAGTFAIAPVVSGTGLTNYDVTPVNGSYTISKAPVTATGGSGSGPYNGQTQSPDSCVVSGAYVGGLTCANNPLSVGPNVGTFAIAPLVSGSGQANFEITLTNGSYTISKALVTATAGSGSGTYNGQTQSPSACAVTGTYKGDLTCANNPVSVGPDVGTFAIAPLVSGTGQANFEITLTDGSYTISKALVTATAGSGSGTYNGQTQSPSACAVTGTYTGDLTCANNPVSVGPDVGTFAIAPLVSGTGQANFEITLTDGSYTISKALVTATAGSGSGSYNGQTQSPAVCAVTGTYTGDLTCANNPASVGPDVGTFPIAPVVSGTGQANFEITLTDGSYTISKALVTATAGSGSGSYNGQTQSPAVCAVTGTYTGDLTCANNPTSVGPDVGTFPIAPVVSGTGQANFEITLTDGSYTISKALVTATAGSGSGSYNGQTQSPAVCAVTGTYTGDLTCANNPASVGPDVGTFPIAPVVSGTGQANFEITLTDGSYTISKALVTATAGSGSGSYNGQTQSPAVCAVTGTYTGDLTCANNPTSVGPDVGTFPIAPVVSGTGQANFEITLTDGSYTISKALVTATAGSGSGSYNGQTQSPAVCAVTGTYTGDLTCANNPTSVGPDVGTFPIAPVVSGTGQANFEITLTDGSYTISKALVTATGGSGSATYNGLTHAPSACVVIGTYTGALTCANNPVSVGPDVGTFAIAPVVSGSGQSNFEITLTNGSYTISKALVTATGGSGSATYNGLTHAPSACVVIGTYTGALTCANNPVSVGPDVGMFAIAPVVGGSGQSNFEVTLTNGSYTISKAPVTATAGSGSGVFSGFTQSPSACAVTGAYTGNLTCANNPASAGPGVGTYVIAPVVSGTGLGNYYITAVNGSYTISAWNLTGFYQPVGIPNSLQTPPGGTLPITGILNTIKGGQTVPLKFEIFETIGGTERTSVSAVLPFTLTPVACDGTSSEDPVDFTTTGGTSLRYDGIDGQFIQNWQSPKPAGKCYRATMTALDGSSISAFFKTK